MLRATWRFLRGGDERPTWWLTRWVILRATGLVYLAAFASLIPQLPGLLGEHGLTPVSRFLPMVARYHEGDWWAIARDVPSVFWIDCSDATMLACCWIGAALALLVTAGFANAPVMAALWILYTSIVNVGQLWFAFGWESQLLETGFLAIFLAPAWRWRSFDEAAPPSIAVLWLERWLIFRIMLGAGLIKLRGDPCWRELTCLDFHFETQPVPGPLSWYFHQLPHWALAGGVLFNHFVELVAPWMVLGPRRVRHLAGISIIAFQLLLIASGNLSFLNHLTIVPALACLDDRLLACLLPRRLRERAQSATASAAAARAAAARAAAASAVPVGRARRTTDVVLVMLVALLSWNVVANLAELGGRRQVMNRAYDPLRLVNTYGAFGSVGDERHELVFEGTRDGEEWREYEFKAKPGDPHRRPPLITPWHWRLDWRIWFAAMEGTRLDDLRKEDWVAQLVQKLLAGEPAVLALLDHDPFPEGPPKLLRVALYRYRFTTPEERAGSGEDGGAWWHRERVRLLIPSLSVDEPDLLRYLEQRGWR